MKKKLLFVSSSAVFLGLNLFGAAGAQTIDSNFARDRNVAVNERAKVGYTPLGLQLGAFSLHPSVEVGAGSNDNIIYDDDRKKSDTFLSLTPTVEITSKWSRHSLSAGFQATSLNYSNESDENSVDWELHANGRFDISSRLNVFGRLGHQDGTESRSSPLSDPNAIEPVKTTSDSASIGMTAVGNRLRFIGVLGSAKISYEDAVSVLDGSAIPESVRNLTTNTYSGRIDYALSPSLSIYVFGEGNKRNYTTTGLDSSGLILAIGTSFDLDKLARGEVQVGSLSQKYDSALGDQNSFYYSGKVEYFPTQITTVTLQANRAYSESRAFGATSALTSTGSIGVDHELLRNLILSGAIVYSSYDFEGIDRNDKRSSVSLGAQYFMNRRMALNVSYKYEKLNSEGSSAFREYTDNSLLASIVFKY